MSPKLHRRTPSSAHTYRLLIFKELANLLACAVLSKRCVRSSKEAELCGTFRTSSSTASTDSSSACVAGLFCPSNTEPAIMEAFLLAVKRLVERSVESPHQSTAYPAHIGSFLTFLKTLWLRGTRNVSKATETWQALFHKRLHSLLLVFGSESAVE